MHFSPQDVARQLNIPVSEYKELENGNALLTYAQARKLAKLYDSETKFFYDAAQQLDQFLTNSILVKTLKADNEHLRAELEKLKG
jgi:plasmid maintenance system antidote protein VapI